MIAPSLHGPLGSPSVRFRSRREIRWTDPGGNRWRANLVPEPAGSANPAETRPRAQVEIQVESEASIPERVLGVGPLADRFPSLPVEDLELVRQAARSRQGILWLDSRDEQLWWVTPEIRSFSNWLLTYSNARWTAISVPHPAVSLALLGIRDHRRLLDRAVRRPDGHTRPQAS